MLYYKSLRDAREALIALGQPVRIKIMEQLYQNEQMSISELSKAVGVTVGAVSTHVAVLEAADLVRIKEVLAKHGTTKLVSAKHDKLSITLEETFITNPFYAEDIKVGHYTSYDVKGMCGIATAKKMVGASDDPRTFSYTDRFNAGILWFEEGFVEYDIPNRLRAKHKIRELDISFEISSFNDDVQNNLSEFEASLNGVCLGKYVCKGDEGGRKGYLTDAWWPDSMTQYGELVNLHITKEGTYTNNDEKLSDVKITDIEIDSKTQIKFRLETPENAENQGGIVIYGEKFGDYPQDIKIKVYYE